MADGSGTIAVLHVDDDPRFLDLTATVLEEDGRFDVLGVTSAADGLERVAEGDVHCVVSDYDMPDCNGIEFLESVRADSPDLPFILFTGMGSEEVASDAISAGVTDYLQKEQDLAQFEVLSNRIENAVERHRAQRRLALQRDQYWRLFEDAPVMYAVTRDDDGAPIVEACNRWFLERLGHDRADVIGEQLGSFYTEESARALLDGGGTNGRWRGGSRPSAGRSSPRTARSSRRCPGGPTLRRGRRPRGHAGALRRVRRGHDGDRGSRPGTPRSVTAAHTS